MLTPLLSASHRLFSITIQKDPENRDQSVSDGTKQNEIQFAPVLAYTIDRKKLFGHKLIICNVREQINVVTN